MAYPTLGPDQYIFDPNGTPPNNGVPQTTPGVYVGSNSDGGQTVTAKLTYDPRYLFTSELYVVPASSPYQIVVSHGGEQQITKPGGATSNSVVFQQDAGVAYYPGGSALTNVGGSPAAGQYSWANTSVGGVGGFGVYTFNAADAGKEIVIRYMYLNPDYDMFALQFSEALDFAAGGLGQAPSAYMEASHPSQAVGYSLTALVESDNGYLGTSGVMPNYSYEVMGFGIVGGGVLDADPIECAELLLTDQFIGIGVPSGVIDAATWRTNASSAANWCAANQFYISQSIENPASAASIIGAWLEAFNVAAIYSEGVIKLLPYGDEAVGVYTPNLTVAAVLTDDQFLGQENSDPVTIERTPWADAWNRVQINYKNRSNSYNDDLVYEQDEASVERFGLRIRGADSVDFITTWQLASAVANMALKRVTQVRNTYEFRLPITFEYLEPMDLVSLTDSRIGLSANVVRITKIDLDPKEGLTVTCEDWPGNGYAMPV